jgi:hypothetical protein
LVAFFFWIFFNCLFHFFFLFFHYPFNLTLSFFSLSFCIFQQDHIISWLSPPSRSHHRDHHFQMTNHNNEALAINLHALDNDLPLDHTLNTLNNTINIAQFHPGLGKPVHIQSHVAQQQTFGHIPPPPIPVIKEEPISQIASPQIHNQPQLQQHQQPACPPQQLLPRQNNPIIIEKPKKAPAKRRTTNNAAQRKRKEQLKAEAEAEGKIESVQADGSGALSAAPVKRKRMSVACLGCRARKVKVSCAVSRAA